MAVRVVFFLLLCLFPAGAWAQDLRVYVVTIGPGELPHERFGHNALLFADPATGQSVAYDWGRFDFAQPGFIRRFVRGDMLYSSGVADGEELLAFYADTLDRRVVLQELNLTASQTSELLSACRVGHLPENRDYRYDYFIANCSTKLRDALDEALDGQLKAQLARVAAGTTFRREAERHMAPDWLLWLGFHAGFGRPADRAIDAWEQCFLPAKLQEWLGTVEVTNAQGQRLPLVARKVMLSEGTFAAPPDKPPSRWRQTGLIGLAVGGALILLSRLRRPAPARMAAATWFLFAGAAGAFLLFLWAFTGHYSGYANQTILLLSPLGLPLAIMTPVRRWQAATAWVAAVHLALCIAGCVLHFVPGLGQENAAVVALALPANLGAAWVAGVRPRWRSTRSSPAAEAAPA